MPLHSAILRARPRAAAAVAASMALACGGNGNGASASASGSASASATDSVGDTDSVGTATMDGDSDAGSASADGSTTSPMDTDSDSDSDSDSATDTGGDFPGACEGEHLALQLMTGEPAPGFEDADTVFESFGRSPQRRGSVLSFTAFVVGGGVADGTEVLYRWDLDAEEEPTPIVVLGEALADTGLTPIGFNGLPVVAEDGTLAYQIVNAGNEGNVHVMRYDAGEHVQILSEGTADSPNGQPIIAVQPFSNFDRGAAYFDGTLAMRVATVDIDGSPAYGVISRIGDDDPEFQMGSGDVFDLPSGHSWEPQEARLHLASAGLTERSLLVWARVSGTSFDRALIAFGGSRTASAILGALSSGWKQVGYRPPDAAFGVYSFNGEVGELVEGAAAFPVKGEAVADVPDLVFGDLQAFAFDDAGGVVFSADTLEVDSMMQPLGTPAIEGLFRRDAQGEFTTLALEGDAAAELDGTLTNLHSVHVSRSGAVVYRAFLSDLMLPNAVGLFAPLSDETLKIVATGDTVALGSGCDPFDVLTVSALEHGVPTQDVELIPYAGGRQIAFDGVSLPAHLELFDPTDPGALPLEAIVTAYVP